MELLRGRLESQVEGLRTRGGRYDVHTPAATSSTIEVISNASRWSVRNNRPTSAGDPNAAVTEAGLVGYCAVPVRAPRLGPDGAAGLQAGAPSVAPAKPEEATMPMTPTTKTPQEKLETMTARLAR